MGELVVPPGFENMGWTAVAAWGANKVFSGSIAAVNDELGAFTRVKVRNALGVFERIGKRIADEDADEDPGVVPERLTLQIVEQAAMLSDPLMQEYLAGVAVSSRTHDDWDDRGVYLSAQIARLSSLQVRAHWYLYSLFHRVLPDDLDLGDAEVVQAHLIGVTAESFIHSLGIPADRFEELATHAATGLAREDLLYPVYTGERPRSALEYDRFPSPGVAAGYSIAGLELFMWVNGVQSSDPNAFPACAIAGPLINAIDIGLGPSRVGPVDGGTTAEGLRQLPLGPRRV